MSNKSYLALFVLLFSFFIAPAKPAHAATLSRPPSNLGLVGYWPMDEGSGTITRNLSSNGSNGNINSATWANGKYGKSLYFNGSTSVNTNYDLSWNNTNFASISFWLKPDNITDYQTGIMGKQYSAWEWGFYQENAEVKLVYWDTTGNHNNGMDSGWGNVLEAGKWVNLSYTWDGTTSRFYKNGVLVNTFVATNSSLNQNRTNSVMFGGNIYIWGDKYFRGALDDTRAYTRVLSATEISKMYSSGQVTRKQVANTGLVGYWSLNDGAGTKAVDSSGNRNNGTLVGGTTWLNGKRGKAINFNGVDSYGDVDLRNSGLTGSQTLSAWVKTSGPPSGKPHQTVLATDPTYQYGIKLMTYKNINRVGLWLGSGSTNYEAFVNTNINDGQWHFVLGVYDYNAGTVTMYIDGVAYSPLSSGQMVINVSDVGKIGRDYHNSDYSYNGIIDDVRIYNRALTATEVQALYKQNETVVNASQNNRLTNGLVGLWSFNGPDYNFASTTAEVLDRSGQSNNGDNTGATVAQGKSGQALSFNGSSRVSVPNATSLSSYTNGVTVSLWFKTSTVAANQGQFGQNGPGYLNFWMASGVGSTNLRWETDSGNAINSTTLIYPNIWYHAVGVYDTSLGSNQSKLYINGSLDSQGTRTFTTSKTAAVTIGDYNSGSYPFNGSLDEVRVYNRALSADEVKQLYNLGK